MYAKIFTQIYDGTLCTRGPWQALVTFQQLLILADQDGNVDMTATAIARRTTIPQKVIDLGISALMMPDAESRTPTDEGRRIVPLSADRNWGWHIVNYEHYRSLKREEDRREYHREYWHKRKLNSTQHAQPNQPIAEAEAEAEATHTVDAAAKRSKPQCVADGGFAEFYEKYPRHVARAAAEKAWAKINPDEPMRERIMAALLHNGFDYREDGRFIPHPATWLNQARWDDEPALLGEHTEPQVNRV